MLNYFFHVFLMPTCRCVFLLGVNSFGWHPLSPLTSTHFLLLWCYLDADLNWLQHLPKFPSLYVVMKALQRRIPSNSSPVVHLVKAAIGHHRCLALLLLVLNEEEDVTQWDGHLTLATGQQVVVGVQARWQGMGQISLQQVGR